jgi:hypothetical protein
LGSFVVGPVTSIGRAELLRFFADRQVPAERRAPVRVSWRFARRRVAEWLPPDA